MDPSAASKTGTARKETFEDVPIDTDPDRFFKAWMDMPVVMTKVFTDNVDKASCYKGDHQVVGGVVEMKYPPGRAMFTRKFTCGRDVFLHTLVDYEKRVHKYDFIEGELKDRCKFYSGTVEVLPGESGATCIVKHEVEFEPLEGTDPHFSSAWMEKTALQYYHRIEQHLKANPTDYTT
eukprot:TRINITY_DN33_c0_g2_i1.p1 TRINITY_DN33_c0_g2~~TRINITY_DN33_c0_g2_i1.p1  ORF type:complete len:178 (-),score=22.17 TRINITY_DN33_c0_g2_i1:346-879(-)